MTKHNCNQVELKQTKYVEGRIQVKHCRGCIRTLLWLLVVVSKHFEEEVPLAFFEEEKEEEDDE